MPGGRASGLGRHEGPSTIRTGGKGVSFTRVARLSEVPVDCGLGVRVGEVPVALFRAEGRIHAMEDRCAHADFPLSSGSVAGCVVTCAAHGWEFDVRTGFDPIHPDGFPVPCFAVREEGGEVYVDIEDVINDPRRRRRAATKA